MYVSIRIIQRVSSSYPVVLLCCVDSHLQERLAKYLAWREAHQSRESNASLPEEAPPPPPGPPPAGRRLATQIKLALAAPWNRFKKV